MYDAARDVECAVGRNLFKLACLLGTDPAEIDRYFWPEHYTIARETLPADMPKKKMLRLVGMAGQHLTAAIAQSIPQSDRVLRTAFGGFASGAIWLLSRYWVEREKPRTET